MLAKTLRWAVDRFGLGPIWNHVLDRQIPKDPWYHGDGMALLILLTILVVTGIFLALSYCPSIEEAYASVTYITESQTLGWYVRGLHYWSGGVMVVMLLIHVCRQVMLGGYKAPREANWLVGVILLFIVLTTSLLGYILRWDERGFYGYRVALHTFQHVPYLGDYLVRLVQGGSEVTSLTLTRLFSMHVVVLPILLLMLVAYHMYLVILHGTTSVGERKQPVKTAEEQRELYEMQAEHPVKGEVFFPTAVIRISPWPLVAFTLVVGLTLMVGPRQLMAPANELSDAMPFEEWWFAWYSALVALLPPAIAPTFQWAFPVALFLLLVSLPFVDRSPQRGWRNRPIATGLTVLAVLAILGLSWLRYQSPWTGWPSAQPPTVPTGVVLAADAENGRLLFPKYGCTSCHMVAGSGQRQVGTDLANMRHFYSQEELRRYILEPPPGVAMPSYAGHLTGADLEHVVAYVLVAQMFPRNLD